MKTLRKQIGIAVILGLALSLNTVQAESKGKIKISNLDCRHIKNPNGISKTVSIPSLSTKIVLSGPIVNGDPECKLIGWNKTNFIQIKYKSKEHVSYSGKTRRVNELEVYRLNGEPKFMFSEPINNMKSLWVTEQNHLLMRIQDKDNTGKPILLNGHIFDPSKKQFTDYKVYAKRHGWAYKE